MIWMERGSQIDEALGDGPTLIYKHSPTCGLSAMAAAEIAAVRRSLPDLPVFGIDVIRHQELSRALALRLGGGHESPQAFVICHGEVRWHGSHHVVKAGALLAALARVEAAAICPARNV